MPHQCLGCGRAFAQGSKEMLKGCPDCKGTRFFYTATPLDDAARAAKAQEVGGDLREVLRAMAAEERLDARSLLAGRTFDDWIRLEGKPTEPSPAPAARPAPPAPAPTPVAGDVPAAAASFDLDAALAQEGASGTSVGTVTVHEPGSYTLDVERLLAANPIVIEREGVYMIHLASAFEAPPPGAAPRRRKGGA